MNNDPFKKVDKFGIQLLLGFAFSLLLIVFSNFAFSEPQWVQKPIQCATPPEVFDRLDRDNLLPLFAASGNARVENQMYTKPYGFFYNQDTKYWAFIEFFDTETMCIVAVGEGVEFDVQN